MKFRDKFFISCALVSVLCTLAGLHAHAAVAVKKAEPVAVQKTGGLQSAASLLPTALNLVSTVTALNQQMKSLSAECIPTSSDITFVTNIMKEYAKAGGPKPDMGSRQPCVTTNDNFDNSAALAASTTGRSACYMSFASETADRGMIWENYPKPSVAKICKKNGGVGCADKDKETVSDLYEIFNLVDFIEADYIAGEWTTAVRLLEKIEVCSTAKLNARKRAMMGEFLIGAAGNIGQKQNAGATMETLSGVLQAGGGNPLQSIMGLAPGLAGGLMNK